MFKPALALMFLFLACSYRLSAQGGSTFVPVTPCRIVDTRNAAGPFGGPALAAGSPRTFLIPSSTCNIPSNASAYSLNFTAIPSSGYVRFLAAWPAGQQQPLVSTLNDPLNAPLANAALVPAGTNGGVNVYVSDQADVIIDINGYFVAQSSSTSTAVGTGASSSGTQNTAVGYNTLQVNSGASNTAVGSLCAVVERNRKQQYRSGGELITVERAWLCEYRAWNAGLGQ